MLLFLIHSFNNVYINLLEPNVYNSAAAGMYTISLQGKLFLQILAKQLDLFQDGQKYLMYVHKITKVNINFHIFRRSFCASLATSA